MTSPETRSFKYTVYCLEAKPPASEGYSYNFRETIPVSLCGPRTNQAAMGKFICDVVERHNEDILLDRAWKCIICRKPAKELLHKPLPVFPRAHDGDEAVYKGEMVDMVAPICRSAGRCDVEADRLVTASYREALPSIQAAPNCERCGRKGELRRCTGCLNI